MLDDGVLHKEVQRPIAFQSPLLFQPLDQLCDPVGNGDQKSGEKILKNFFTFFSVNAELSNSGLFSVSLVSFLGFLLSAVVYGFFYPLNSSCRILFPSCYSELSIFITIFSLALYLKLLTFFCRKKNCNIKFIFSLFSLFDNFFNRNKNKEK